jgi:hypothetical protein
LLRQNSGLSKKDFELIAREQGFKRATVRDFIDRSLAAKTILYRHGCLDPIDSIAA